MSDVTIKQLSKLVHTTPERLLKQLKEAGVSVSDDETQIITDAEKRTLLMHLKEAHRKSDLGEKKQQTPLTLKRKKTGVIKQKGRSSVTVEFRSKLSYTRRAPHSLPKETSEEQFTQRTASVKKPEPIAKSNQESENTLKETAVSVVETTSGKISASHISHIKERDIKNSLATPLPSPSKNSRKRLSRSRSKQNLEKTREKEREALHNNISKGKGQSLRRKKKVESVLLEQNISKSIPPKEVPLPETITIANLAQKMSVKAAEVIKIMMNMGAMATINQVIDRETATILIKKMGHKPVALREKRREGDWLSGGVASSLGDAAQRAPVVTVMGHVDHGKTSLLDYIRRTKVSASEAGGITQQIGAYHVNTKQGMITFLDTPGHEAFTAMRARGAQCTDIIVLVVAADDGVMPQTIEAIQHAHAAKVPIVVAINKIDKSEADPDRIKTLLSQHDLVPEDWGGDVIFQTISAKTGIGIDALLDSILLQAEMLELKAPNQGLASGIVLESKLDKSRGPIASVLVTQGELRKGDIVLAGREYGRVRAMFGENSLPRELAGPSMPVEILGLSGTPMAGDDIRVVQNERKARQITQFRKEKYRDIRLAQQQAAKLDNFFTRKASSENTLHIVLKADAQGSLEAITEALNKLSTEEVKVNITGGGVGGINESDINLAIASHAVLLGFKVRADASSRALAAKSSVDLRYYSIIYNLINEIKDALSGMLAPKIKEKTTGLARVREVFRSSKLGAIVGCIVTEGVVKLNVPIRVLRDDVVIYQGELESLRRFKEDATEVRSGTECGIGVKNYNDIKVGDQIEVYETIKVARKL